MVRGLQLVMHVTSVRKASGKGFTLIEVLVTILIVAVGLLGFASLQVTTLNQQFEALQRAQVTAMIEDMAARIRMNPSEAISGAYYGAASGTTCASLTGADRDLCEWNGMMLGSAAVKGDLNLAAPIGVQGCIEAGAPKSGETVLRVSMAWQGITQSAAPSESLGCGADSFGDDAYRRVLFRDVVVR